MIPMLLPPAIQASAPASKLAKAENAFLLDLDAGVEPKAAPELDARDRAAFIWLKQASAWKAGDRPASPFAKGSAGDSEAKAWSAFLGGAKGDAAKLPLRMTGSRMLLWSWMRDREHHGPLPKAQRQALEDRLLAGGPAVIRGWALRHALCFLVAEKDFARFADLKARHGAEAPDTFTAVQSLLSLFGSPGPEFRLWHLPDLAYRDLLLKDLGARLVWICPPGPTAPEGAAWIIPSETGDQNEREASLNLDRRQEADKLAAQVKGQAWFAASRSAWEASGLQWFPILIVLNPEGDITSVRMGDAAP